MKVWRLGMMAWLLATAAWPQTNTTPTPPATATMAATTNVVVAPPAKDFNLQSVNGRPIRLDKLAGQPVLLLFWATGDEPSRKQVAALLPLLQQFGSNGVVAVGIAIDQQGPVAVRQYVREHDVPFPVAMLTSEMLQDYGGLTAIPAVVLLDRNHNIIRRYVGVTSTETLATDITLILKSEPPR